MSFASQQVNTLSSNDFRLVTLGRLALVGPGGADDASLGKRRRKLALLAVLARAGRPVERDFLIEMFWGDQDEERARHSLSDALSHLRRVLGPDSISTRRTDVSLDGSARVEVDALELEAAAAARSWQRVTELYAGPFLDFIYVERSASFEHWVAREREHFLALFTRASANHCFTLARARRWEECAPLAQRWLDTEPLSADAALYLLNALKAPATRDADARALAAYRQLVSRLAREYDATPDDKVSTLATDIASRLAARSAPVATASAAPAAPPAPAHEAPPAATAASTQAAAPPAPVAVENPGPNRSTGPTSSARRRRMMVWMSLAAAGIAIAGTLGVAALRANAVAPSTRPAIAIVGIRNLTGDTTLSWLTTGLPQMIVADLSRSSAVDVVDPSRVQQVLARATLPESGALPLRTTLDVGRRVGATWVVDGTLSRTDGKLILSFNVHDAATQALVRPYTVSDADVMSLADHAAARLLVAANANAPGPRLSEVETSSLEAYQHYVRAMQAGDEGRGLDQRREVDAAIALDSGFVAALRMRIMLSSDDGAAQDTLARLLAAFKRAAPRASEHDRLEQNGYVALRNGERMRSEALARLLVRDYPRDPHSYSTLAGVYATHGMWAAADTVLMQELALDSLAAEAGEGPCAPCIAYGGLISNRANAGDLPGAEHVADRWIALQPDLPMPWSMLSTILSYEQRFDEALQIQRRAAALAGNDPQSLIRIGRVMIMARRWHQADSLITLWSRRPSREWRTGALDLRMLLQRERGQFRASIRTADALRELIPGGGELDLMTGNSFGVIGDYVSATRSYEEHAHASTVPGAVVSPVGALAGDRARQFSWEHALEADAIAGSGDTVRLHVLADSIDLISSRSYYGRDWRLAHHVRGLIAMQGHRYAEAVREFQAAQWGVAGWTRTVAELAQAQLALGQPRDAIVTLREAYMGPLDAMGRYEPRSQLDFLMAKAFQAAGMTDSATVYGSYVRTAWKDADPEVKRLLLGLRDGTNAAVADDRRSVSGGA